MAFSPLLHLWGGYPLQHWFRWSAWITGRVPPVATGGIVYLVFDSGEEVYAIFGDRRQVPPVATGGIPYLVFDSGQEVYAIFGDG